MQPASSFIMPAIAACALSAHAAIAPIQLTDEDQQLLEASRSSLISLTLPFLLDSWPLEIMSPGEAQEEFFGLLRSCAMLDQFRQTGDLTLATPDRTTPLILCTALGLNDLAMRMIKAGAPVNVQTISIRDGIREPGDTPLTWASSMAAIYETSTAEERLPLVQALLQHGADPDQAGPYGVTPFIMAAALNDTHPGQDKIALSLLDAGPADLKNRLDSKARAAGFFSLSPAIYERLIDAGFDVNERFFDSKQSPLHLVCTKEQPAERLIPLIDMLIKAGADPNQTDKDGLSPLMACNTPEIAVCLLNHGAKPGLRNEDGQNAVEFHQKNGYADIAEAIIKWQAQQREKARNQ